MTNYVFSRLPLRFLGCKSSSQHTQNASQLKRIQHSFQESALLLFFFVEYTGVKHLYPIVIKRTLPYSDLLEIVNLTYSPRSKDLQRHCAWRNLCITVQVQWRLRLFSINTHVHLMQCICIEYFPFISQFSIEESAAFSLKENLLRVKRYRKQ